LRAICRGGDRAFRDDAAARRQIRKAAEAVVPDVPDGNGGWGEGRTDADVAFWRKWEAAGNTLHIANRVTIGHMELMVRWPGHDLSAVHQSVADWRDQIWPASQLTPVAATFETLQLSRWPEVSIVSFTEDGTALVEGTDYVIEKDVGQAIRLDAQSGRRRHWNATPKVVQYTAGYSAIPSEVEDAVIRMVTRRFRAKGRDPNLRQQSIPGVLEQSWWIATGSDSGNLTPDIVDLLDNYRAPVIA
jgi:hypothetical protein